jgi:hypothetical protein
MRTAIAVIDGRHRRDITKNFNNALQKKSARGIDVSGVHRVSQHLYGDAARGCLHRGNGPDATEWTISSHRQRLGILINEGVRGEARGVAEEVRVGVILTTSNHHMEPAKPMEPIGSISLGEGGTENGS